MEEKCLLMFSGGLDSRLVVKIMQEKCFSITAVYFKLPFGGSSEKEVKDFIKENEIKLKVFDCTKGKLLQEYLEVIKEAKHGTGSGVNPCVDCRLFMFNKIKGFADSENIKYIFTGEVAGQRPMSQKKKQIKLIEKESGLSGRIIRPLIDLGIEGRQRKKQIALAEKFKIKYPSPAGGCLLCERYLKCRFEFLLKRGLNEMEVKLVNVGRHFLINGSWVILGRNENENKILESADVGKLIIPDFIGPSALIFEYKDDSEAKIRELIKAYSKKGNSKDKRLFDNFKI